MPIQVQVFAATSALAPHPRVEVFVPVQYKILGGGALDNWSGAGNLLTAAYPENLNKWVAEGKDHKLSSPATITGYALALYDPNDEWDVIIQSDTSAPASHPDAVATVPAGYILTGGGAQVHYTGAGNLLTASYPNAASSWEARSKDHELSDPATITAYAIGLKHRANLIQLLRTVVNVTGSNVAHPTATACLDAGWVLSGGGALDNWTGYGNLLTGSYPQGPCWTATGKDHLQSSPATITAYAIGIREP